MTSRGNRVGGHVVNGQQVQPGAIDYPKLSAAAQATLAGLRNKLINGNFGIWQRGTSLSAGGYLADRFSVNINGTTIVQSRQAFTLGQTAVPGEPTYHHRTVVTSVAGAGNYAILTQRIEGVRTLAGQSAVLSFYAKADAAKNIAIEFEQLFGTGGSPSAAVSAIGVTTKTLTTSWQQFKVPVTLPSLTGKTLGANGDDNLGLNFWLDAGSNFNGRTNSLGQQSGTFDIAQVQLEVGSDATPFEQRPAGLDLALCQRYYETGILPTLYFAGVTFTAIMDPIRFSVQKRTTPTMAYNSVSYYSAGTPTAISTNISTVGVDATVATLYISGGMTNCNGISGGIFTASAEL